MKSVNDNESISKLKQGNKTQEWHYDLQQFTWELYFLEPSISPWLFPVRISTIEVQNQDV